MISSSVMIARSLLLHLRSRCSPGLIIRLLSLPSSSSALTASSILLEASDSATEADVLKNLTLMPDFLTESEEASLISELQPALRRLRYESAHWDDAIQNYREMERSSWKEPNQAVLSRVASAAGLMGANRLEHVHVLDLAEDGHIRPHVDAVRFCGSIIAGLSLLSDSVMRFSLAKSAGQDPSWAKVLLPRRSLYVMRDRLRYDYAHAVLGNDDPDNRIGQLAVRKTRRVSVICRCQPDPERVRAADANDADGGGDQRTI